VKKIHLLLIRAFINPFIATFFVVMFILIMFFLFKYVDDIIGKGLPWYTILEMMYYQCLVQISMALPLSVLLSSIMTFGTLGENYELVAIKSAGISLQKAMRPLFVVIFCLSLTSLWFSNFILPIANLKLGSTIYDVTKTKLAFLIKPGVFNNSIPNYSIRVDSKDENDKLFGLMIYDHRGSNGIPKIIVAKEGEMAKTPDEKFLIITLKDGVQYEEQAGKSTTYNPRQVLNRTRFRKTQVRLDLSTFGISKTDPNIYKTSTVALNLKGLTQKRDSLIKKMDTVNLMTTLNVGSNFKQNDIAKGYSKLKVVPKVINQDILKSIPNGNRNNSIVGASATISNIMQNLRGRVDMHKNLSGDIINTKVEYQRKFTLAASCILLFFIGAPLGAIIRKGGMGLPVVIAVVFFLVYHIITTVAEKSAKDGSLNPILGMWMAFIVLTPLAIFLTYKATADSAIFDVNYYKQFFVKLLSFKKKNK
jgi:lipopolysaccharide export system permease protein